MLRTISISLLALGAVSLATPASAQGFWHMITHSGEAVVPSKTATVSFADLDVTKEAGAKILLSRIKSKAAQICGPAPSSIIDFRMVDTYKKCVNTAVNNAVSGSNQALLINLHHAGGHGMTGATEGK